MDQYEVEIASEGRSGDVIYKEQESHLTFWREFSMRGAYINILLDKNRNSFCERSNAPWGKDRKAEIIERIAFETSRQQAPSAEIEEEWINLYF